jgi:hypothetical protein
LDDGLADQINSPVSRHRITPNPRPSPPGEFSYFLASYFTIRFCHKAIWRNLEPGHSKERFVNFNAITEWLNPLVIWDY